MPPDFEPNKQEMPDEADNRDLLQHVCALQPCFIVILNRQTAIF